ncbi:MAG: GIY-YIG nuclease family protein [Candidatus Omnitrophota bacterium]
MAIEWTRERARLIGRIIFADFLEYPLGKNKKFIEAAEASPFFEKTVTGWRWLSGAGVSERAEEHSRKAVAEITGNAGKFTIKYTAAVFNKIYGFNKKIPPLSVFYRLKRINARNELTHRILKGIIERQKEFLSTGNPMDLAPFSQIQLVEGLNGNQLPKIDSSRISRLVNRLSVTTPSGEEKMLKSFFPTRKDVNKKLIKKILDKENESGRSKKPLTDNRIRAVLESEYGVKLSRHSIGHCRGGMGIPPANRRLSGYKYPPLSANFSALYPLTVESVQNNAPAGPGIYEFRLRGKEVKYPNGKTGVIYIGSAGNIRKRLKEHLGKNSKNSRIRRFLRERGCAFRYIQFSKSWRQEERRLYDLFASTYGAPPGCNRMRPYYINSRQDQEENKK